MADSSHFDVNITTSTDSTGGVTISAVQSNVYESSRIDSTIIGGGRGPAGPANSLAIGTVQSGSATTASITGDAPSQTLNLTIEKGTDGYNPMTISSTAPTSPRQGDLWYKP